MSLKPSISDNAPENKITGKKRANLASVRIFQKYRSKRRDKEIKRKRLREIKKEINRKRSTWDNREDYKFGKVIKERIRREIEIEIEIKRDKERDKDINLR